MQNITTGVSPTLYEIGHMYGRGQCLKLLK